MSSFFRTASTPVSAPVAVLEPEPEVQAPVVEVKPEPVLSQADLNRLTSKLRPISELVADSRIWTPYEDRIIARPGFGIDSDGQIFTFDREDAGLNPIYLNSNSRVESQLASKFKMPSAMPAQLREIGAADELCAIFNKASRATNAENMLIRSNGAGGFAALSSSYRRFDNRQVLDPILNSLGAGWMVKEAYHKDPGFSRFYLVNMESMRIINGDRLFVGLEMTNAEDGSGALNFNLSIMRLACLNGLTVPFGAIATTKIVHRGQRHMPGFLPPAGGFPQEVFDMVPDQDGIFRLAETALDKVHLAMSTNAYFDGLDFGMAKHLGLSFSERDRFFQAKQGYDNSLWGWTNSVTELGKTENVRRNAEIQRKGWSFLDTALRNDAFLRHLASEGREVRAREAALIK